MKPLPAAGSKIVLVLSGGKGGPLQGRLWFNGWFLIDDYFLNSKTSALKMIPILE